MKTLKYLVAVSLALGLFGSANAADPAVKKASSGICHDSSSPNFGQIKDFQPYKTLDACVKSGGTLPATKTAPAAATPAVPAAPAVPATPAKPSTPATPATPAKPAAAEKAPAAPAAKTTAAGQVKKSSSGICHEPGSEYYDRTKDFEPFKTMADCIKSGGRAPK